MAKATTPSTSGQKDVYGIVNDRILEQLEKGIVPWRINWHMGGPPTNLISKLPYRGINALLLGIAGCELNYFLTENQLGEIGGTIRPNETPHTVVFWNNKDDGGNEKKQGTLGYYKVYNVGQCEGISEELAKPFMHSDDPADFCENLFSNMPHRPEIRHKEAHSYYDPLSDIVNVPKKSNKNKVDYYASLLHQLVHSTGHHTRLDRMGLVQMTEVGYQKGSLEELVTEIATGQLYSLTGLKGFDESWMLTATEWYEAICTNKYLIFNACNLSLKVIDYILNMNNDDNISTEGE